MGRLYFGGAFNPIHHGHLICARAGAEAAGLAGVVLIPTSSPPFKQSGADLAPARDRAAMCDLAAALAPHDFSVDTLELDRSGTSYTFDTVRALTARDGQRVNWLIGADTLPFLHQWHRADELLAEADFWVMARPGYPIAWDRLSPLVQKLRDRVAPVPQIDISATQIRQRSARGQPIEFLTAAPVCEFIRRNHLYGA